MDEINISHLKNWFIDKQRSLPWRENRSPYAIWVSEIMLQQTQVAVVIPYFQRWMERFPSIQQLADSPLEDVLKTWEGLGYYSRARNLHAGAKYILANHQGIFPNSLSEIAKIKGIGPYTLGAIASFAFHQREAAVDGNVMRVLARYYCIEDDLAKTKTVAHIRKTAQDLLPKDESWIINEALIELGAVVCNRKPQCNLCPLKLGCQAYLKGKTALLPFKSTKTDITLLHRTAAVIRHHNHILIRQIEPGEIMAGLHEFPYFETLENNDLGSKEIEDQISDKFQCPVVWVQDLPLVKHSFTRFKVLLKSKIFTAKEKISPPNNYQWISIDEINRLAFSSGHRKILLLAKEAIG